MPLDKLHTLFSAAFQQVWQSANSTQDMIPALEAFPKRLEKTFKREHVVNFLRSYEVVLKRVLVEYKKQIESEETVTNQKQNGTSTEPSPNPSAKHAHNLFQKLLDFFENHALQSDETVDIIKEIVDRVRPILVEGEKVMLYEQQLRQREEEERQRLEEERKKTAHLRRAAEEKERRKKELARKQQERRAAALKRQKEEMQARKPPLPARPLMVPISQAIKDSLQYQELFHKEELMGALRELSSQESNKYPLVDLGLDSLNSSQFLTSFNDTNSTVNSIVPSKDILNQIESLASQLKSHNDQYTPISENEFAFQDFLLKDLTPKRRLVIKVKSPSDMAADALINYGDASRCFSLYEEMQELPQEEKMNENQRTTYNRQMEITPPITVLNLRDCVNFYTDRIGMIEELRNEITTIGDMPAPGKKKGTKFLSSLSVHYESSLRMASFIVHLNVKHPAFRIIVDLDKSIIKRVECDLNDPRIILQQMLYDIESYRQFSAGGIVSKLREMIFDDVEQQHQRHEV
eukprot:CAMPEP_0117438350 /NCGR_PEP_ID=MMETSP0759-20121206/2008_1 /TAXON_ID=63605 /ORGANISM="Percolomonas cosmopolitus, Strain WS" /LENGTH=519 /DNA_ID=CAMNT_0005230039 /DNA_START=298 /DNA_END=1857 /DNA_ORIENTATION=+